jgi:hypothetical protein
MEISTNVGKDGGSYPLLVGMQISAATVEISMGIPENIKNKPIMMAHFCNPCTWEAEAGGPWVPGQPWKSKILNSLSYRARPHLTKQKQQQINKCVNKSK